MRELGICALLVAAAAPMGCAQLDPPAEVVLASATPEAFSRGGERPQMERWWLAFGDEGLTALIETALEASPSIRAAWDRLAAADALARRAGAARLPDVTLSADAARSVAVRGEPGGSVGLTLGASYEVDLWGRVAATVDSAIFDVEASRADLHTAAVTLSAEIAAAWFELVERKAQLALIARQIGTSQSQRELIELRFQIGEADAEDLLRQRQLVSALRGGRYDILARIEELENQLSVLAGRAPGTLAIEVPDRVGDPPPLPETGVPLAMIRARPDLVSALAAVRAVDRDLAAAIADKYPQVNITPSLSTSGTSAETFLSGWLFSLAAGIVAPVFDAGSREAEVDRQRALVSLAINEYETAALTAVAEIETALARELRQRQKIANLREQIALGRQILEGLSVRYTQGTANYLDVLSARDSLQDLERSLLIARRDLNLIHVELARSLAGGWVLDMPAPRVPVRTASGDTAS